MDCLRIKSTSMFKSWSQKWVVVKDCSIKWYKNEKHISVLDNKIKYGLVEETIQNLEE